MQIVRDILEIEVNGVTNKFKIIDGKYIEGKALIDIEDIINTDREGFLDMLSKELTGTILLMEISYNISNFVIDSLWFDVRADASSIIEAIKESE